jgi:hypothetical protein
LRKRKELSSNVRELIKRCVADQRVRKVVGSDATEYFYFGGQLITERKANGDWTDYIYAGNQRIAKADTLGNKIHISGTNCSTCGLQYSLFAFPSSSAYAG